MYIMYTERTDLMKKIIGIFLIVALVLSFASCSEKISDGKITTEAESTVAPPVIQAKTQRKEFEDENGKTVYVVEVNLPQVTSYADETMIKYVNRVSNEIFEEACGTAEDNVENASNFLSQFDSDLPWTNKIDFETTYCDGRFVCFLIKSCYSFQGGDDDPIYSTRCFDLKNGIPCSALNFALVDDFTEDELRDEIVDYFIIPQAQENFFPNNPNSLSEEMKERFREFFSVDNFLITESGMQFYYHKNLINEKLSGTFVCELSWDRISSILISPKTVIEYDDDAEEF